MSKLKQLRPRPVHVFAAACGESGPNSRIFQGTCDVMSRLLVPAVSEVDVCRRDSRMFVQRLIRSQHYCQRYEGEQCQKSRGRLVVLGIVNVVSECRLDTVPDQDTWTVQDFAQFVRNFVALAIKDSLTFENAQERDKLLVSRFMKTL